MSKLTMYKAAGLLYKADQIVEELKKNDSQNLSIAYRIRNNAFAVAMIEQIGLKSASTDNLQTLINDREITVKTKNIKRLLGTQYDEIIKNNLPQQKPQIQNETLEKESETANITVQSAKIIATDSPVLSETDVIDFDLLEDDFGSVNQKKSELKQTAKNEVTAKDASILNTSKNNNDEVAQNETKLDKPLNTESQKSINKSNNQKTEKPELIQINNNNTKNTVTTNPAQQTTKQTNFNAQKPEHKSVSAKPALKNFKILKDGAVANTQKPLLEIKVAGTRNYIISKPNNEEQLPRKAEDFLYDKYEIERPGKETITCLVFPIMLPAEGVRICNVAALAKTSSDVVFAASTNDIALAELSIDDAKIYVNGAIDDGKFTSSATFPGMPERHVIKTEFRPSSTNATIGHFVYNAGQADAIHIFPIMMVPEQNVVCPAYGAHVQKFGDKISVSPFLSSAGDITIKCEKAKIRIISFWKNGKFDIKTEIKTRG